MDPIEVRWLSEEPGTAEILIEGLPGIGHVGKLVAEYLIDELRAERIAEIYSLHFPPQVIIGPDGVARLARNEVFLHEGDKGIAFLVGDYQSVSAEGHYLLAEAYLDIAERLGVRRIFTLGGYGVGHLVSEPRVLSAVNRGELRAGVEAAGAEFTCDEPPGGIIGASGLLLGLSLRRGMDAVCLMGETSGYLVDPRAASGLLTVLSALTGVEVDRSRLETRAAEMEQVIAKLTEGEKPGDDEALRYFG
ncbi:MAG TPA: proteasome assembly chaperone family protein [Methanomicrobiales archaeon]|nr:proteasome assembly chaperone family protein [Methanomicrobiales archaeon]